MLLKFALLCVLGMVVCQEKVAVKEPLPFGPTTTDDPDTTTPPPTTTIPPETTTSTSTSTSTSTPTTTSAPTPSTPVPPADIGSWNVTDPATNVTCIMAKMAVQLSISYSMGDNKTGTAIIDVPANTSTVSGSCGNETQSIIISWKPDSLDKMNTLLLVFSQNSTSKMYMLSTVNLTVNPDSINFPGAATTDEMMLTSEAADKLPSAPLSMSYRCTPSQSYNLTGNSMLILSQLQLEAFHKDGEAKFGAASDCQAQDSADIVPIAVGCALAALVVIVLIAYLIGRRRTHAKGYLSM